MEAARGVEPGRRVVSLHNPGEGRVPNLVVMRVDGSQTIDLGSGAEPLWSPDSSKLIFLRPDPGGGTYLEDDLMLVNRDDWQAIPLDLPPGSRQIVWLTGE